MDQSEDGSDGGTVALLLVVLIMSRQFLLTTNGENVYMLLTWLERTDIMNQETAASLLQNQSRNSNLT